MSNNYAEVEERIQDALDAYLSKIGLSYLFWPQNSMSHINDFELAFKDDKVVWHDREQTND